MKNYLGVKETQGDHDKLIKTYYLTKESYEKESY